MNYGIGIRWARSKAGLTQRELAKLLDVDNSYVHMLETGKRSPSVEMLDKVARACRVFGLELFEHCAEAKDRPKAKKLPTRRVSKKVKGAR